MSATTPDVPLHPHTDRWVFRSGGESGRVSRAERRGVYGDDEARRACADAGEKPDRPWHRTTSSSRILTLRSRRVKAFLSLGEFAHDATAGIFNDYVALQVWAGTPDKIVARFCAITLLAFSALLRSWNLLPACLSCIRGYTFPCAPGPSSPNQPCSSSLAGSFRSLHSLKTPPGRKTPLPGVQHTKRTSSSRTAGFLSPALNGSSPGTIP